MLKSILPRSVVLALACSAALCVQAAGLESVNIPAGELKAALELLSKQSGVELMYSPDQLKGIRTPGVSGSMSLEAAVAKLLQGTPLILRTDELSGALLITTRTSAVQEKTSFETRDAGETDQSELAADGSKRSSGLDSVLEEVTITSNRISFGRDERTLREVPQSVSVITRQRIEDQNLLTLTEAMTAATGITVVSAGTNRETYSARGFDLNIFQVDGIPIDRSNQDVVLSPDLGIYERIEVLRGANGLLQGSGNASGTVNMVRKRPKDRFAGAAVLSAGSWNNYRGELDLTGPLNQSGTLRGRTVLSHQDSDFFYDVAHQKKTVLHGIVEYDLRPDLVLSAGYTQTLLEQTPLGAGLPRYTDGSDIGLPRSTFLGPKWAHMDFDNKNAFVELAWTAANGWVTRVVGNYLKGSNQWRTAAIVGWVDPATGTGPFLDSADFPSNVEHTGVDAFTQGDISLFGRTHHLMFGGSTRSVEDTLAYYVLNPSGGPADIFNWNPASVPVPVRVQPAFLESTLDTSESGLYASGRFSVADPLTISVGARVSWWKFAQHYSDGDFVYVGPPSKVSGDGVVTPYAGIVYELNDTFSVYGSYADIFLPQVRALEFPGKPIDPIVGANTELGIKGEFLDRTLFASLAMFRIDQKNRALPDPQRPCAAGSPVCYFVPDGEVSSEGFEAEMSGRLGGNWEVAAGYTFNTTKYEKDRDAANAPTVNEGAAFSSYTPKHLFKLWSTYRLPGLQGRWRLGGGVHAQSESYVQSGAVRAVQDAYWLASLNASYQMAEKTSVSLYVNNLFDETYYNLRSPFWIFYGEPRSLTLTLRTSF
ncbi:TonB-dependent siderophore receptor [Steroidobacter sp.]|uniref:TonB-dependent siderophore receptor n=1 Tax=Steroidobacter sp. TaxID=1978227 RepID=UPI001A57592C|nr:TonB-dependent receptor [Steroidobacter sp.]MBL8268478.1 TonB-dependent siderophore receptor [Steroidobacter sp.]